MRCLPSRVNTGVLASVIWGGRLIRWSLIGSNGGPEAARAGPAAASPEPPAMSANRMTAKWRRELGIYLHS